MKCKHDDCFTCPYPDCIVGSRDAYVDPEKLREQKEKRKKYQQKYYREHRKEISEINHRNYMKKKYNGKFI